MGRYILICCGLVWSMQVAAATTSIFPEWHISGSNTLRVETYQNKGNAAASPYRFEGGHYYDEINLNFNRNFTPYNRFSGQVSGLLYNDSLYRSQFSGTVLERISLRQENGDAATPYRLDVGDFFAYQSYRTIQRSLKGARIELQPRWGNSDMRHSIELFTGTATPNWDTFQYNDDYSSGISWLVQQPELGSLSANFIYNYKQENGLAQPKLSQYVGSLAWEQRSTVLGHQLITEAEFGRFVGDHPVVIAGVPNTNRQGNGLFGQISGTPDELPQFSYRFRGEAYEQDYIPNGASIQSDRNSQEGYLTWRTKKGLAFTVRGQHFRTAWQTTNPTDTYTYGGNLSGVMPVLDGVSGNIDVFGTDVENRTLTVNTTARVANINLNKSVNKDLSLRGGYFYSNNHDKNNAVSGLVITQQFTAGANIRINWRGVTGTVSPGMVARRFQQQTIKRWDYNPSVNASLLYGSHQLSLNLSQLNQSSQVVNGGVDTATAGLNYRFSQPKYTFGVDVNWYDRQPDNTVTQDTQAWRIASYLTYNFDRPAQQVAAATQSNSNASSTITPSIARMRLDVSQLMPNMDLSTANTLITDAGFGKATNQAGYLVWYAQIFRDINETQRLVLEKQNDRVVRSAVIVDVGSQSNVAGIQNLFERMSRQLISTYGQPDSFFEQGDFDANLATELVAGRFIRVMEWKRNGGTLRFGIPRRLDGQIRMELQSGSSFPTFKDTLWSVEEVL